MTKEKRKKGWRMSCDVGEATEGLVHSPTFPSLHLRHNSFSNSSVRFTYITAHLPILPLLHLRHSSFSNPSFASPTSRDFHLRHLASRPCPFPQIHPTNILHSPFPQLHLIISISSQYLKKFWLAIAG